MLRRFLPLLCACGLLSLGACAKPDLATTLVRAGNAEELAATRTELADRFGPAALAAYDTAIQELQLAGMDRGVATAAERAAQMRAAVDGRTVRAVEILGWQARRTRIQGEIKLFEDMLARDIALRDRTAAQGTPPAVLDRIASENDMLTKLRRLLAETERQLAAWGAPDAPTARESRR